MEAAANEATARRGRGGARVEGSCTNPLPRPPAADRVLVIRLGALGDVVRTLPAVSALRAAYAGSHIAWLVEPAAWSALDGQPWIDEVIVFPRPALTEALRRGHWLEAAGALRRFVRGLRRRRFDLVVDFHGIAKSALLARASGARRCVGYAPPFARESSWRLMHERARLAPARVSRFVRNRGLVEFLGVAATPHPTPLRVDPRARARAARALGHPGRWVALHAGTSPQTPHKRWPAAGFAAVARALAQDGFVPVVTFGPGAAERRLAETVVAESAGAARLAPPTRSVGELAAVLASCRLLVSADSGPLHVASLVGTPVVQLLGPTDPVENAPWEGTPSRTVRVPVACSPCRRGCAAAPCMRRIRPEDVLAAARALLAMPAAGW